MEEVMKVMKARFDQASPLPLSLVLKINTGNGPNGSLAEYVRSLSGEIEVLDIRFDTNPHPEVDAMYSFFRTGWMGAWVLVVCDVLKDLTIDFSYDLERDDIRSKDHLERLFKD